MKKAPNGRVKPKLAPAPTLVSLELEMLAILRRGRLVLFSIVITAGAEFFGYFLSVQKVTGWFLTTRTIKRGDSYP